MSERDLRSYLVAQLGSEYAHAGFHKAIDDWPARARGDRPGGSHHSAWEIVEHLRIAQWDILEFSRSADHASPEWPEGYWPSSPAPVDDGAWESSIAAFDRELAAMQALVSDPAVDLYQVFAHGTGQTLLKESLTLASHNSYHIGQLMILRKLLGP
jgi:hypothetical protein